MVAWGRASIPILEKVAIVNDQHDFSVAESGKFHRDVAARVSPSLSRAPALLSEGSSLLTLVWGSGPCHQSWRRGFGSISMASLLVRCVYEEIVLAPAAVAPRRNSGSSWPRPS
jgi:hypothetical protein